MFVNKSPSLTTVKPTDFGKKPTVILYFWKFPEGF